MKNLSLSILRYAFVRMASYKLQIAGILFLILFFFFNIGVRAAYLKNIPVTVVQPNGDTLHCYASGDEFYNYLHDKDGYTIIQNNEGYYMYAAYEGKLIVPSQWMAGETDPAAAGLQPNVTITTEEYYSRRAKWFNYEDIPRSTTSEKNHGTLNNLVVFIRFADEGEITTQFATVNNMFNNQSAEYNSMYNYFHTTSYGQLTILSHFFPEPDGNLILSYQDEYPRNYYQPYHEVTNPNGYQDWERTEREHVLLRNAIEYIANTVPADINLDYDNNGTVDNVCFVVKGNTTDWATLLWPHRWALYSEYVDIRGIQVWDYNFMLEGASGYFNTAVLSHEMQHSLSYPDLYHYANSGPTPVGNWDIMESNPNPPQQSGGYLKWKYGNWLFEPTIIQPGKYTLNSIGNGMGFVSYKIPSPASEQFFVLEYRDSNDLFENFGNYGAVSGMLIYRINTTWDGNAGYNPNEGVYDEVYVFRPGGNSPSQNGTIRQANFGVSGRTTFDATSNPKPFLTDGTFITNLAITDITVANNKVSFTYNGGTTQFYGVAFHPNGGEGRMAPQLFEDAVEQNLRANSFLFQDKIFAGWALTPNGEVVYTDKQSIAVNEDIILYAKWKSSAPPVYYTITASFESRIPLKDEWGNSIDPEGEIQVLEHTNQSFVIQADSTNGFHIAEINIDNGIIYYSNWSDENKIYQMIYTFEDVTENHTIHVTFFQYGYGINEKTKTDCLFTLQPNPANNYIEIVSESALFRSGITAQIFDSRGLLIKTWQLYKEYTQMDISDLPRGFYIVKIGNEAKKLIVK